MHSAGTGDTDPAQRSEDVLSSFSHNSVGPQSVDLSGTLAIMESRKSMRRIRGSYHRTRSGLAIGLFFLLVLLSLLEDVIFDFEVHSLRIEFIMHFGEHAWQIACNAFFWFLVFVFLFVLIFIQVQYRLMWSWGVTIIYVVIQIVLLAKLSSGNYVIQESLLGAYIGTQLLLFGLHAAVWHYLPAAQLRIGWLAKLDMRPVRSRKKFTRAHTLRPDTVIPSSSLHASTAHYYCGPIARLFPAWVRSKYQQLLSYEGEVDAEGRPDGYGIWADTDWHGERLQGIWRRGRPIGPFKARETGSGSAFVSVRIGFLQNRRDRPTSWGTCHTGPANAGIITVECCTSGVFFRGFPHVTEMEGPWPCTAAASRPHSTPASPTFGPPMRTASKNAWPRVTSHMLTRASYKLRSALSWQSEDHDTAVEDVEAGAPALVRLSKPECNGDVHDSAQMVEESDTLEDLSCSSVQDATRAAAATAPRSKSLDLHQSQSADPLELLLPPVAGPLGDTLKRVAGGLQGVHYAPQDESVVVTADASWGILVSGHYRSHEASPRHVSIAISDNVQQQQQRDENSSQMPTVCDPGGQTTSATATNEHATAQPVDRTVAETNDLASQQQPGMHTPAAYALSRSPPKQEHVALELQRTSSSKRSSSSISSSSEPPDFDQHLVADQRLGESLSQPQHGKQPQPQGAAHDAADHADRIVHLKAGMLSSESQPSPLCHHLQMPRSMSLGSQPTGEGSHRPRKRQRGVRFQHSNGHSRPPVHTQTSGVQRDAAKAFSTSLRVDGWSSISGDSQHQEALIYTHGFNCCLADACKSLAQFLALANLPPHIKPFVFSWPTGTYSNYITAIRTGAQSHQTQSDFVGMIRALAALGFRSFHIMAHSVGVRVVMASVPLLEQLFQPPPSPSASPSGKSLFTFSRSGLGRHQWGAFARRGQQSPADSPAHLHESAGQHDNAAADAQRRRLHRSRSQGLRLASITLMNPDAPLASFVGGDGQRLAQLCQLVTVYGDRKDVALWGAAIVVGLHAAWSAGPKHWPAFRLHPTAGRHIYELCDSEGQPLDLDVIDMTFLDANVQGVRHMSFNLNSSLVEDLRDLLVTQRRAHQRRGRLEPRGGNVFSFLVAPSYVKNP